MVKISVSAKINLSLFVTGKTNNGYHNLDSIVSSISLFDTVKVSKSNGNSNSIYLSESSAEKVIPYSAQRCIDSFTALFGTPYVDIYATKNIPLGGGLGGSSALSAGIILGLCKLFGIDSHCEKVKSFAKSQGADVLYQMAGGLAHMQGVGDELVFFDVPNTLHLVVAKGKDSINTADCFKLYDASFLSESNSNNPSTDINYSSKNLDLIAKLQQGNFTDLQSYFCNHLFAPAKQLCPDIDIILAKLKHFQPLAISMSGSGSTVFALFQTKEKCLQVKQALKNDIHYIDYVNTINKGILT